MHQAVAFPPLYKLSFDCKQKVGGASVHLDILKSLKKTARNGAFTCFKPEVFALT